MLQMSDLHAIARTLADDIMLLAKGSRALHILQVAFEATLIHMEDIGGRLAPTNPVSLLPFLHTVRGLPLMFGHPFSSKYRWFPISET